MKRSTRVARNQLVLSLEREEPHPLDEETREAVIAALADLLLEAYGEQVASGNNGQGGSHEP
jgi:hypothetical protein